jgi:hypothetical protein
MQKFIYCTKKEDHKRRSVTTPALETLRELVDLRSYRAIVMDRYSESPKDRIEW